MVYETIILPDDGLTTIQAVAENLRDKLIACIVDTCSEYVVYSEEIVTSGILRKKAICKDNPKLGYGVEVLSGNSFATYCIAPNGTNLIIKNTINNINTSLNVKIFIKHSFGGWGIKLDIITPNSTIDMKSTAFFKIDGIQYYSNNGLFDLANANYAQSIGLPTPLNQSVLLCTEYHKYKPIEDLYSYKSNPSVANGTIKTFGGNDYFILTPTLCLKV